MIPVAGTTNERAEGTNFSSPDRPTWDLYSRCIHCGLCLNECPTYRVLGTEMDSPRGRIYQVLQVDAGRVPLAESFVLHMDRCLGCRACESACPSGVQYGRILERVRAEITTSYPRPRLATKLRNWFYRSVLPNPAAIRKLASALRIYQISGIQPLVRATGALRILGLREVEALTPAIDTVNFYREIGRLFPAEGERRGRVAMLAGCISNVAFAHLNRATIRVLQKNGIEVVVPEGQTCCGALSAHSGYSSEAREMARRNIDAFTCDDVDAIVSNAGGCGAALKEYEEWLAGDPQYAGRARRFVDKVRDVTEYLAEIGLRTPERKLDIIVTYQESCHLAHGQKVRSAPRELLQAIGVELREMPRADSCCGSAGTYNVTQNELSMKILDTKMSDIASTGASTIAATNTGCMLQLRAGVQRAKLNMRVAHVIELLDQAYE